MTGTETETPKPLGQQIGEANQATAAVLDHLLAETGTTFLGWATLNSLAVGDSPVAQDQLVGRLADGLELDRSALVAQLDELDGLGLIRQVPSTNGETVPPAVELTQAGDALFRHLRDRIDRASARLYDGIPWADLATTRRVLAEVTERANRHLQTKAGPGPRPRAGDVPQADHGPEVSRAPETDHNPAAGTKPPASRAPKTDRDPAAGTGPQAAYGR